jgi:hypothetical protein
MNITLKETLIQIATRIPPGDSWQLIKDGENSTVYKSLTDTLQAYFESTGFKGEYRLAPLSGKIYIISQEEVEVPVEQPKTYSFYGDVFRQGI